MHLTQFGNSPFKVSKMGLGLAALGRPGYINFGHGEDLQGDYDVASMEQRTFSMLDRAYEQGIRYFDVARSYGRAEAFLSAWLGTKQASDLVVGSKWGYYYTADWKVNAEKHEIKEHTIEQLNKQWPLSKELLSPQLKIYHIHSATFESGVLKNSQVLARLEELQAEGVIIGLSLSGPQQAQVLDMALKIVVSERPLFGSVQATYNVLERSVEKALQRAADQGLGVIIKEAVANGRLTTRNSVAPFFDKLSQMADDHGVGTDALVMAFILSKPFVNVVLSGAVVPDHLDSNVAALAVDLSNKEIAVMNELVMDPADYWSRREQMAWN